ncbi:hypothetical protein PBRA_007766 [Plasmodiophora brassicae]|uniref:Uncharacterized protein n=1 Tax=Plasmodiophora brassicae TaxID=37360 RepID=A0A0G4IXP9_PLABS|nr:hypothetical protein PBRA_007766 [Plasmodiophora brassicae]
MPLTLQDAPANVRPLALAVPISFDKVTFVSPPIRMTGDAVPERQALLVLATVTVRSVGRQVFTFAMVPSGAPLARIRPDARDSGPTMPVGNHDGTTPYLDDTAAVRVAFGAVNPASTRTTPTLQINDKCGNRWLWLHRGRSSLPGGQFSCRTEVSDGGHC